jgi:hypothetical protein
MAFVTLLIFSIALYIVYIAVFRQPKVNAPVPPGPKGLPLLGNIKDLPPPDKPEYEHWFKHKTTYGPISSVEVLGQTIIISSMTGKSP